MSRNGVAHLSKKRRKCRATRPASCRRFVQIGCEQSRLNERCNGFRPDGGRLLCPFVPAHCGIATVSFDLASPPYVSHTLRHSSALLMNLWSAEVKRSHRHHSERTPATEVTNPIVGAPAGRSSVIRRKHRATRCKIYDSITF